jgi:hypothetical protein
MRRLLLLLMLCLTGAVSALSQTTVNLTVQDTPDNQLWANGTWAVQLQQGAGNSDQTRTFTILSGGGSLANQSGSLSGTATASIVLPANANIGPGGTKWQFTVCPQASASCFQQSVTVSTSSPQTLAINPPSIRINLATATPPISAYATGEISGAVIGSQFYLLGTGIQVCSAVSGNTCTTWTAGGGISSAGPNQNVIYASPNCIGSQLNCFPVKADAKWATDASFTNTSGAVVLSASDPAASASDVGKICFGTTFNASTHGDTYVAYVVLMSQGTISSVTDGQHLTCSTTSNSTATGSFVWGSDDTAALTAAWNAASSAGVCKSLDLPRGGMLVQSPVGNTTNCTKTGIVSPNDYEWQVYGKGMRTTVLIPTPTFSFTGLGPQNGVFFNAGQALSIRDFSVNGFGNCVTSAPANTRVLVLTLDTYPQNIDVDIWGCSDTNLAAWGDAGFGSYGFNINDNGGGGIGLTVTGTTTTEEAFFCCNVNSVLSVGAGGNYTDSLSGFTGSGCGAAMISINATGTAVFNASGFLPACSSGNLNGIDNSGTLKLIGAHSTSAVAANAIIGESGSTTYASGTLSSTTSSGFTWNMTAGSTFIDGGGNSSVTGGVQSLGALVPSPLDVVGMCTGTATSSSTLGLYGTGPNEVLTTCTSTTIGTGVLQTKAGKILSLGVIASHAGVNASSGVVTVLKNGSPTTLTCTVGTGTSCSDFAVAHQVSVVKGDLVSIQFTTQGTEVLAGVQAAVLVM